MDSPSRNPLLHDFQHGDNSDDENSESGNVDNVQVTSAKNARRPSSLPVDTWKFVYIMFYFLGMTSILPWNFFVTAEEYWQYKFRNLSSNDSDILTPRQIQFQPDLAMCSAIPNTIFLILNAFYGHRISLRLRMIGSMIVILILFVITTAFVKINTDDYQDYFFVFTLTTVFVVNIFSAIVSGGLFGMSGMFPSEYISAVMSGQALGGVVTALAEVISISFATGLPTISSFIFFLVGTAMLILGLVFYMSAEKTLFFKVHINQSQVKTTNRVAINSNVETSSELVANVSRHYMQPDWTKICSKIWVHGFSAFLVFVTTLAVYPAITVLITSVDKGNHNKWNNVYFLPCLNYLLFNSGDYIGRILSGWIKRPRNQPNLIAFLTVLRIGFIPAFLLCNITQKHPLPVLIHSDEIFILLMTAFSISNGYLANISLIYAPAVVEEHEKEMTSSMMAAFMGIGLTVGSAISFVLIQFVS